MEKVSSNTQQTTSSHKINQPNQGFGGVREPFNGKSPSNPSANIQQQHYQQQQQQQQQFYSQSKYSSKPHQTPSPHQQIPSSSIPSGHMASSFGQTPNPTNFGYPHSVATSSYQSQQSYDYNSPSSSSMSTMNYATPSPSQYSFASSSPSASTIQESSDIRQQNLPQAAPLPSMDDENDATRDYAMSNQFKMSSDNKTYNPTQHSNYSIDSMSGHYSAGNDNCAYPTEMKTSLKKYRHKQQPNSKTPSVYGPGTSDFKMDDQYGNYPMEGESTLSFLEKTASSIDESKSAFKASLSNITKPTPDMLGYGSQSLYGNSSSTPVKAKAKPRSRSRKTGNKTENLMSSDPISSPVQPLPMKQTEKMPQSSMINTKEDIMDPRSKPSSSGWRMDDKSAASKQMSTEHYAGSIGSMGLHSMSSTEKNLTIPHTDVNTTYNHSDQTYQYSGHPSTHVPPSQFLLSHSHSKPESSMYSSHGTVHHPYTRAETSVSNSPTVTSNSCNSGIQSQTNTASMSNPYPVHSSFSSLQQQQQQQQQPTISLNSSSQQTSTLSASTPFSNTPFDPLKTAQSHNSHLLPHQEQSSAASLPHAPQIDSLGLYSHSQHYSPYGKGCLHYF